MISSSGCSGRDARFAVQFLESRIANQNVLGGVDHQQTVGERGQYSTDFGCVFRNLAVELALAGQQLFQGKPDPAGMGVPPRRKVGGCSPRPILVRRCSSSRQGRR